jgi:hypothetical protein
LVPLLNDLKARNLVDELVHYEAKSFSKEDKRKLVSTSVTEETLGGTVDTVSDVFFNELTKREIGRLKCVSNGCTHFICSDADEYYVKEELRYAKKVVLEYDLDATACRLVIFRYI